MFPDEEITPPVSKAQVTKTPLTFKCWINIITFFYNIGGN
jgi:hypothetical protein